MTGPQSLTRRAVLGSAVALAACDRSANSQPAAIPPLKSIAPCAIGTAIQAEQLRDPLLTALVLEHCSQLTAEWEMKMEYIVQPDGSFRFDAPDAIAGFASREGLRLFGHTLVWYSQAPPAFERLDETRARFADAYRAYITAVVGRYRGQAVGWDVVNEAVAEDGEGWRESLWASRLGDFEHMRLAFEIAHEADPSAVLFLNDYNLEYLPKKRFTFLRLVERLLKAGAPLTGLGTQTHLAADQAPGETRKAIRELASVGLPIHVSELDVSLARAGRFISRGNLIQRQTALYGEVAEAVAELPEHQRFGLTLWGLRDKDSWLRRENAGDAPAPFDDQGMPKAGAEAMSRAWSGG